MTTTIDENIPSRNSPCHCGSDQKYKHCHLTTDRLPAAPGADVKLSPSRAARRLTAKRKLPRVRAGEGNAVEELLGWLAQHKFERIHVVRTSDTSKANFDAMRRMSLGDRDDDAVVWAYELGMDVVMSWGEPLRSLLGVFTVRRRHVPGGTGTALVGFLIPSPDGKTLFAFVLNSAATANVISLDGRPENDRNAFTELLCLLVNEQRPAQLLTPLLTRLIRDMRWAGQVASALRRAGTRLIVNGVEQKLKKQNDEFVFSVLSGFATKERRDINERLGGIEGGIRHDGQWYGGEQMLPFTWRFAGEERVDPLTGEYRRVVPDKHLLECAPRAVDRLRILVDAALEQANSLADIATVLGKAGVTSRAPKYHNQMVTLDRLRQPASAARSLLQIEWINAWRHGTYDVVTVVKEDALDVLPTDAEVTCGADGRYYLESSVSMPAPVGGWGITDEEWDRLLLLRLRDTPQGIARRSPKDLLRPLCSLVQYEDGARQWRLATFHSGDSYEVLSRPLSAAFNDGNPVGWDHTTAAHVRHAMLPTSLTHAALGSAIREALERIEAGDVSVLLRSPSQQSVDPVAVAEAEERRQRAGKALAAKQRVLELNVDPDLSDMFEDEVRAAERALREATIHLERLRRAERPAEGAASGVIHAAMTVEVVAAGLLRGDARLHPAFNQALFALFRGSARLRSAQHGSSWTFEATLHLPMRDGREALVPITTAPIRGNANRNRRATSERTRTAPASEQTSTDTLARLFFLEGMALDAIARARGLADDSGGSNSWVYKAIAAWLVEHQVPRAAASAALDIPILATRSALYRGLTIGPGDDAFAQHVHRTYTTPGQVGQLWGDAAWQDSRAVFDVLRTLPHGRGLVPSVAAAANLDDARVGEFITEGRPTRRKGAEGSRRPALFHTEPASAIAVAQRLIVLLACTHCHDDGESAWLVPTLCAEVPDGMLCERCRRQPGDAAVTFPEAYLLRWGSRRDTFATTTGRDVVVIHTLPLPGEPMEGTVFRI